MTRATMARSRVDLSKSKPFFILCFKTLVLIYRLADLTHLQSNGERKREREREREGEREREREREGEREKEREIEREICISVR